MSHDYLLVGLGNPGKEYIATRHNFGFLVVSYFADLYQIKFIKSAKCHGMVGRGEIDGRKIHLLLPSTYMNISGVAVKALAKEKAIELDHILVVCDDLNLDFGDLRIRARGSAGGHHGLNSVVEHLGSQEIPRLRLGIGSSGDKAQTTDFVLSDFKVSEKKRLQGIVAEAAECCHIFLTVGISQAMSRFNKRSKQEEER